jgi:hypothetical protein
MPSSPTIPKGKTSLDVFLARIRLIEDPHEFLYVEARIEDHYNLGLLSAKERNRLYGATLRKRFQLRKLGQEQ